MILFTGWLSYQLLLDLKRYPRSGAAELRVALLLFQPSMATVALVQTSFLVPRLHATLLGDCWVCLLLSTI